MRTRPATPADAAGIAEIYNHGIEARVATFETTLRTEADILRWFDQPYPVVVVEIGDETRVKNPEVETLEVETLKIKTLRVAAFAATSSYRPRACYAGIAEFMVYVAPKEQRQGLGRAALEALFDAARDHGLHKLVSRVFTDNHASRRLLNSVGFREVGVYERHAQLDGVWRDVVIVERLLD